MRVIAGEFRSRKLIAPEGLETRPTSDRLREALFNILGSEVEGSVFVDGYAGSGAVGIEALSRGARRAIFIEKHRDAVKAIQQNVLVLNLEPRTHIIKGAVALNLAGQNAGIIFLDPPYAKVREYQACFEVLEGEPPPLTVVQHSSGLKLEEEYSKMRRTRVLKQGENELSFYRRAE